MTRVECGMFALNYRGFIRIGAWAGIIGGLAEVAWISLYSNLVGGNAIAVAQGITATVARGFTGSAASLPFGLLVHFGLAALLGAALAVLLRALFPENVGTFAGSALVVLALAGIWALNFLIILPAINPEFVTLVPLWASFTTKMLFGRPLGCGCAVRNPDRGHSARTITGKELSHVTGTDPYVAPHLRCPWHHRCSVGVCRNPERQR